MILLRPLIAFSALLAAGGLSAQSAARAPIVDAPAGAVRGEARLEGDPVRLIE